jgi:membrane-associated phospholipid phosphatase
VSPALTKLATLISAATRLPLLAAPLFLAVGARAAGTQGLLWGLVCLFLTSGLSLSYLFYLAGSGKVRDPRSISRVERVRPLRVVAALHVGAFLIVTLLGAPAQLRAALLSYALATLIFAFLTPLTNLSLHAAGVSGAAVCLIYVFGARGLPAVLLVPPVWWARTQLGRHTPTELALGALVGGGATLVAFQLIV